MFTEGERNLHTVGYSARHLITKAKEHTSDCKSSKRAIKDHI